MNETRLIGRWGYPVEDSRKLEVKDVDNGFEFNIGRLWCSVYLHEPPIADWNEEKKDFMSYVRYYPEFSILVTQ